MLSQAKIRFIHQLLRKKIRYDQRCFIVEGNKGVKEGLEGGLTVRELYVTDQSSHVFSGAQVITEKEMKKISQLTTPSDSLAVFNFPKIKDWQDADWVLALDEIQDPGNLGTIIRTADWFGFKHILCGEGTVDPFHPKVVQATMGSYARVQCHLIDLEAGLQQQDRTVVGADLEGVPLKNYNVPSKGVLVIGNEGRGLSRSVEKLLDEKVTIERGEGSKAESLNAAISTAVILHTISNRLLSQN
jgi:TrmH family RNA methyltransferase